MEILALSGFLGLPRDWDFLSWKHLVAVDWQAQAFSWNSLSEWGTEFNRWVKSEKQSPNILMGYSLGGRLALHALVDQPSLWRAAIMISAHPGLANREERKKRIEQDQQWARRFEKEEWTSLMQAWNVQGVFAQDSFHFERQENDYQREQLAKVLIQGSLGLQVDLRSQIASLPIPILWVTGCKDHRFCQIAQTVTFAHPHSQWKQIEEAGHRVPWSQPKLFSEIVQTFLQQIQFY